MTDGRSQAWWYDPGPYDLIIKPPILFEDLQLFYFLRTIFCSNENPFFCIDQFLYQSWRQQLLFHFKYFVKANPGIGIFVNIYSIVHIARDQLWYFRQSYDLSRVRSSDSEQIPGGVNKTVDQIKYILLRWRYLLHELFQRLFLFIQSFQLLEITLLKIHES